MYCPICAKNAPEGAGFCRKCGIDLRLIPQALAGERLDEKEVMGWSGSTWYVLLSLVMAYASIGSVGLFGSGSWIFAVSLFLAGVTFFAAAAVSAYLKLHPSVQIGYVERVRDVVVAFGVVFASVGGVLASQLAGLALPWWVALLAPVLVGPKIVQTLGTLYGAEREAIEQLDDESEEEGSVAEATTTWLAERRAAWQLAPPPSIVSMRVDTAAVEGEDARVTARLPSRSNV
jgi:hypothetical protein